MFRATGDPARRKLRPGPRRPPDWSTVPAPGSQVVVTGASGGLGRALPSALAEVGAEVVGIDRPGTEGVASCGTNREADVLQRPLERNSAAKSRRSLC